MWSTAVSGGPYPCGDDKFSGENYDYRRQWIENWIRLLADSFAASLYSYAAGRDTTSNTRSSYIYWRSTRNGCR